MKILGMDHIAISVRDLAEAEDFYTRILGGTIERRIGDTESDKEAGRVPQVIIKLADSVVFNLNASNPQVPDGHFIHWAMQADFEDLDEWIETFQRENIKYYGPYGHGGRSGGRGAKLPPGLPQPRSRRSPVRADSPWGVGIHYPIRMTRNSSYGIDTRSPLSSRFVTGA